MNGPDGRDNPRRQVIINTPSPVGVGEVPEDCLVVVEPHEASGQPIGLTGRVSTVRFAALEGTWRTKKGGVIPCAKGTLLSYLNPFAGAEQSQPRVAGRRRVVDRPDMQQLFSFTQDPGHEH